MQNLNLNKTPNLETTKNTKQHSYSIQELETALACYNIEQSILILNFFKLLTHENENDITIDQANLFQHKLESLISKISLDELEELTMSTQKIKSKKTLFKKLELKQKKLKKTLLQIQKQEENLRKELNSIEDSKKKILKEIENLQISLKELSHKAEQLSNIYTSLQKEKKQIFDKMKKIQDQIDLNPIKSAQFIAKILPTFITKKPKKRVNLKKLLINLYKYKIITEGKKETISQIEKIKSAILS